MAKMNFCNEFKNKVAELEEVRCPEDVIIHFIGEEPSNEDEERFIRDTNIKYFNTDNSKFLLGNFAEIRVGFTADETKSSFIRVNLSDVFDKYNETNGWDQVIESVKNDIRYATHVEVDGDAVSLLDNLCNYEAISSRLILRPLNFKNNKAALEDFTYWLFGDIALVLYAVVLDDEENSALNTIKIPKAISNEWGIPVNEEMFGEIMKNTMLFAPASIHSNIMEIEKDTEEECALMSRKFKTEHYDGNMVPLVTTSKRTNGAISLFYPGVKEKIAELFGDGFYVAFTSIHEAMVHKNGTINPEVIKRHIAAVNRTFGPVETLTEEVYFFDKEAGTFEICEV